MIDSGSHHGGGGGGSHHHHGHGGGHGSSGGGGHNPRPVDRRTAISISSYVQFMEGEADKKAMKFYVRLSKPAPSDLQIGYRLQTGNPSSTNSLSIDDDIVRPSGVVTIQRGQTTGTISIHVKNDTIAEEPEYFRIVLQKPHQNQDRQSPL